MKSTPNAQLLKPIQIGDLKLPHRIFMAPLTRSRSLKEGHTQTPLHALYYSQRASAGLIISEATQISQQGQGYAWTPGIYTDKQVEGWKLVTDAIHNAGGRIFVQLWHVGAVSHNVFQPEGKNPVSSSEWTPKGQAFVGDYHPQGPVVPHPKADALTKSQIKKIIEDYKHAARCAKEAHFDGVELHAANGYLIDQFLRDSVNRRDDEYGGSIENRIRFLNEVVDALCEVLPPSRIGVRLTPMGGPGGSFDSHPKAVYTAAAKSLAGRGLAYLHVVRANDHGGNAKDLEQGDSVIAEMRKAFDGPLIANADFTPEEADRWIAEGYADAVAFGRLFIANPDLPERIAQNGPYNEANGTTFYGGTHVGYTDYESLKKTKDAL
ncbi:MAG: alkene reductase [Bdellovibrionales bacterium]|nr:alkene reductase [Bdellovibrionales bacterium]